MTSALLRSDPAQRSVWLLTENAGLSSRKNQLGVVTKEIEVSLFEISSGAYFYTESVFYRTDTAAAGGLMDAAQQLLRKHSRAGDIVVAGTKFAPNWFCPVMQELRLDFVLKLLKSTKLDAADGGARAGTVAELLADSPKWIDVEASAPNCAGAKRYSAAELGRASLAGVQNVSIFAVAAGGITNSLRGVEPAASSLASKNLVELLDLLGWLRWLRPAARRAVRASRQQVSARRRPSEKIAFSRQVPLFSKSQLNLPLLIDTPRSLDGWEAVMAAAQKAESSCREVLRSNRLTVVELFAGAGGLGLGFLMSNALKGARYQICFSGEANTVYTNTLRYNYGQLQTLNEAFAGSHLETSIEPIDLALSSARRRLCSLKQRLGEVDFVIGGPPCQGFSNANRNSNSVCNPNNALVNVFLDHVSALSPKVVLFENVDGMLSARSEGLSLMLEHLADRLLRMNYLVFPRVLDAAWYGVPQRRNRLIVIGLHRELGYELQDFDYWGPFPAPTHGPGTGIEFTTVRDALADLPPIENGASEECLQRPGNAESAFAEEMRKYADETVVWDHVASRHADYVIERYRKIPEGENWRAVRDMMTNYSDADRTHSNIYRRLKWDEPSLTISHYRKAMLIHPEQHRGLSLREACRLQSFPDWFRFAGSADSIAGGLMHKQQQLANAVCPLMARALGGFLKRI